MFVKYHVNDGILFMKCLVNVPMVIKGNCKIRPCDGAGYANYECLAIL